MDDLANTPERSLDSYRDYLRLLARLELGSRLQSKLDAPDVVQQAILQAHKNRSQFCGHTEAEWLAWLRAILANALAATRRRFETRSRELSRERSLEADLERSSSRLECLLAADHSSPSERAVRCEELLRLAISAENVARKSLLRTSNSPGLQELRYTM